MARNRNVISYPQPDAPKLTTSPLETLSPNPTFQPSILAKYGYHALGGAIGFSMVFFQNYFGKRPIISGLYRYPIFTALGVACLHYTMQFKENQWAERDAVLRHYISLHPEDFPAYERKKIGDIFEPWVPIR